MIPIAAILQRKLQALLSKAGATGSETALTVQEVEALWPKIGIKALRKLAVERQLKFGVIRGKIKKTDNDKYYLNIKK